ncbi:hypothetical protein [Chitinophaga qingshengii]|uniref:Xanthan lyase n=1 Tax=Chitinophaga qingshengii TaxID=1569794 RepID=A0ABR7TF75_9BACT|nr:hypothetical protein [Chitinophaga qingshengii]MBC9928971.1 hypothetical protein [Chitinophaga qingshengii]
MNFIKKIIIPVAGFLVWNACTGVKPAIVVKNNGPAATAAIPLMGDTAFSDGIILRGSNSAAPAVADTIKPFDEAMEVPRWMLAEWGSRHLLNRVQPQRAANKVIYANDGKKMVFERTAKGTRIDMEIFTSAEFKEARKDGEDWPHLLLEQSFPHPLRMDSMSALWLKMDTRLMYCMNKMKPATYRKKLHTAQFSLYLAINNRNRHSAGYGDFVWFGVPLYDYRYNDIKRYEARDKGKADATGKFIYSLAGREVYTGSFHDGKWRHISKDLYPAIRRAFETAKRNGYLKSSSWDDMYITGMNIGWEVPGTFDAGLQLEGLSLTAVVAPVVVKVKRNGIPGKDCDFAGNRGIEDAIESIRDASATKPYVIEAGPGTYEALRPADFNSAGSGPGNYAFIRGKDYVSLRGTDREAVVIRGELPDKLGASFSYESYQTIYWHARSGSMEHITVTAKNIRYPVHIDGGATGMAGAYTYLGHVNLVHDGNTGDAARWRSWHPLGLGMSEGQVLEVVSSVFRSPSWPLYMHTNADFRRPCKFICRHSRFEGTGQGKLLACFQSLGSHRKDEIVLDSCTWNAGYVIQSDDVPYLSSRGTGRYYNHCDLKISGRGNSPLLWNPAFGGQVLKITAASTVQLDTLSSAYPLIMKGSVPPASHGVEHFVGGYAYRKGQGEVKAYARGCVDIADTPDIQQGYGRALGNRLGDCSCNTKILGVIVDGTRYDIVFNKNYAGGKTGPPAFSNEQVINEIRRVLGRSATVSLYTVGNDYYPDLSDCVSRETAGETIPKGAAVQKNSAERLIKAPAGAQSIYGVALDDMLPEEAGRVLIRGYLSTDPGQCFYVLLEKPAAVKKGSRLTVGAAAGYLAISSKDGLFPAIENNVVGINTP